MGRLYSVNVTRDLTETTQVEVTARTPEEANEQALALVEAEPWEFEFELDDGRGEPYLGDDSEDGPTEV